MSSSSTAFFSFAIGKEGRREVERDYLRRARANLGGRQRVTETTHDIYIWAESFPSSESNSVYAECAPTVLYRTDLGAAVSVSPRSEFQWFNVFQPLRDILLSTWACEKALAFAFVSSLHFLMMYGSRRVFLLRSLRAAHVPNNSTPQAKFLDNDITRAVDIAWCPSHCNIQGNDRADELAIMRRHS